MIGYKDFKNMGSYFQWRGKICEICIEPCFNGADIAVYDLKYNLLEPKFCTNLKNFGPMQLPEIWDIIEFKNLALKKVNEYYSKYELN